jgi:hypothetical protein
MRSVHRSLLFLASAVSLSLAACGGGDDGGDDGDDTGPTGTHTQSVLNKMILPVGPNDDLKMDIDGNGRTENRLGSILATLQSQSGGELDLQASIDRGVNTGDITLLGDIQAEALTTATNAGFRVYLGMIQSPVACTNPDDDTTCGQHLQGTGSFVAEPSDALVKGNIVNGRFTGEDGELTLKLALEGTLIDLNLIAAKAELTVTADGITEGIIGGAITKAELDTNVIPAVGATIQNIIEDDCVGTPNEGGADLCGCPSGTGRTLRGLFDTDNSCEVTQTEVSDSPFIRTLLSPDLDLLEPTMQADSLSVAVGITTVKATWPQLPE